MTNVGGKRRKGHLKEDMEHWSQAEKDRFNRRNVITDVEFQEMLNHAQEIKDEFFRLRALACLCIFRLTGKRREEVARLEMNDVKVENKLLNLTFTLEKKRKQKVLTSQATKSIPLSDPLVSPILNFHKYLTMLKPSPKFFFPRIKSIFGHNIMLLEHHTSGRQLFNIIRSLSQQVWPHLFRETAASDVVKSDPTIIGAFKVQRRLDLEDYRTGFNYVKRFASDVIQREIKELEQNAQAQT